MEAPDIRGTDLQGRPLSLSEFRGKVVLLECWGQWCTQCRQLYPKEEALSAEFRDRPFAIVGVNSDPDLETALSTVKEEGITWRSFWDGEEGTRGPIATAWNVRGWPVLYVIDHRGIIRSKTSGSRGWDAAEEAVRRWVEVVER